jgi:competence protein ComEC
MKKNRLLIRSSIAAAVIALVASYGIIQSPARQPAANEEFKARNSPNPCDKLTGQEKSKCLEKEARRTAKVEKNICPSDWEGKLVIHHIYVGQGDATFIRTPSGTTILIDSGLEGMGEKAVIPRIKECYKGKVTTIDYLVLTHPHVDHFGGLTGIFEKNLIKVNKLYQGSLVVERNKPDTIFNKYMTTAKTRGLVPTVPKLGNNVILDKGHQVSFSILAANGSVLGRSIVQGVLDEKGAPREANSVSIAMTIRYKTFDYFIGGDLTGGGKNTPDVERAVASIASKIDVFHSNHHGSDTSNSSSLLNVLNPTNIIISVGNGSVNRSNYHLPDKVTIDRMHALKNVENIFLLARGESPDLPDNFNGYNKLKDFEGDVILVTDGEKYFITGDNNLNFSFRTDGHPNR